MNYNLLLCDLDNTLVIENKMNLRLINYLCSKRKRIEIWCTSNRSSIPPEMINKSIINFYLNFEKIETPVTHLLRIWPSLKNPIKIYCSDLIQEYLLKQGKIFNNSSNERNYKTLILLYKNNYNLNEINSIKFGLRHYYKDFLIAHVDKTILSNQDNSTDFPNMGQIFDLISENINCNPFVLGKPNPQLVNSMAIFNNFLYKKKLIIGDDFFTDREFARRLNADVFIINTNFSLMGNFFVYDSFSNNKNSKKKKNKLISLEELI